MSKKEVEKIKQLVLGGETYIGKKRNIKYTERFTYQLIDKNGTELSREFGTVKEALQYCI